MIDKNAIPQTYIYHPFLTPNLLLIINSCYGYFKRNKSTYFRSNVGVHFTPHNSVFWLIRWFCGIQFRECGLVTYHSESSLSCLNLQKFIKTSFRNRNITMEIYKTMYKSRSIYVGIIALSRKKHFRPRFFYLLDYITFSEISKCGNQKKIKIELKSKM